MIQTKGKREKADTMDKAANRVADRVARERARLISRRKWAIETAMLSADEMTAAARIDLARAIDAYVYEGEAS